MTRIFKLQCALLNEINKYEKIITDLERDEPTDWERVHLSSCAKIGLMLAESRGCDPELSACACAVHDYGRITTGKQSGHAEAGYLPVQEFLRRMELFTEEEVQTIAIAVKNHSKKAEVGTPIEEIVKDADVLDCYQYGNELPREEQQKRLEALLKKKF